VDPVPAPHQSDANLQPLSCGYSTAPLRASTSISLNPDTDPDPAFQVNPDPDQYTDTDPILNPDPVF
jgi:hypothetical protein